MPSKRTPRAHGSSVPRELLILLALGTGWNRHNESWLREQWREHGAQVSAYWMRKFERPPFAELILGELGDDDAD